MDDTYLTVREVSERLRVTRQAIYNWIAEGRLKAIKVGKSVRVSRASIEAFIQPVKPGEQLEDEDVGNWTPELIAA